MRRGEIDHVAGALYCAGSGDRASSWAAAPASVRAFYRRLAKAAIAACAEDA